MNFSCKSAANRKTSPSVKILVKVHLSNLRISPKQQPQWIVLTPIQYRISKVRSIICEFFFNLTTFEETKNFTQNFGWIQLKCPSKTENFFYFVRTSDIWKNRKAAAGIQKTLRISGKIQCSQIFFYQQDKTLRN